MHAERLVVHGLLLVSLEAVAFELYQGALELTDGALAPVRQVTVQTSRIGEPVVFDRRGAVGSSAGSAY